MSLIGVPLTVGFVSKWWLIVGLLEAGSPFLAALALFSSLLAVAYVWRVVEVAYLEKPPEGAAPVSEAPLSLLIPTWMLIGATVWFGVFTDHSAGVANLAATAILGTP